MHYLKRCGCILISFYGIHLTWVVFFSFHNLLSGPGQYLGVAIPNMPLVLGGHFLLRVLLDPIPLGLFVGLAGGVLTGWLKTAPTKLWLAIFGVVTYAAFNAFLLIQVPGALVSFPILRRLPFIVDYLLLGSLPAIALVCLFRATGRTGLAWAWLGVIVGAISLPHDTLRALKSMGRGSIQAQDPRLMVLVLDAARLDEMEAALPPDAQGQWGRGISHFGSTRKQWRLLLTGNLELTEQSFLIPTRAEFLATEREALLPAIARRSGLRTSFFIDDPRTVNLASLGVDFDEYGAPSEGMSEAIMAELTVFPICGWLWNVLAPVEGANAWSRPEVYFRDVARALQHNSIVLAHTIVLQTNLASVDEFLAYYGKGWIWLKPTDSHFVSQRQEGAEGVDALTVYRLKLKNVLALFDRHKAVFTSRYANFSGLLTSDHGQEFAKISGIGKHYAGLHGWDLSPEVVWTPLLPFGHAGFSGPADGNLTWLSIRQAMLDWIERPGHLNLRRISDPVVLRTHYIVKSQINGEQQDAISPDLITIKRIIGSVELQWDSIFLSKEFASRPYRMSVGVAKGRYLRITNPTTGDSAVTTEWDLYQLKRESKSDGQGPQLAGTRK
jgi:hypothetical protein